MPKNLFKLFSVCRIYCVFYIGKLAYRYCSLIDYRTVGMLAIDLYSELLSCPLLQPPDKLLTQATRRVQALLSFRKCQKEVVRSQMEKKVVTILDSYDCQQHLKLEHLYFIVSQQKNFLIFFFLSIVSLYFFNTNNFRELSLSLFLSP